IFEILWPDKHNQHESFLFFNSLGIENLIDIDRVNSVYLKGRVVDYIRKKDNKIISAIMLNNISAKSTDIKKNTKNITGYFNILDLTDTDKKTYGPYYLKASCGKIYKLIVPNEIERLSEKLKRPSMFEIIENPEDIHGFKLPDDSATYAIYINKYVNIKGVITTVLVDNTIVDAIWVKDINTIGE
ncbi:MAG: hypothetical protein HQK51_12655, partial [Oligoflexia bacterium]|nr:hypothetical protein [Oligoflexia bacterium]